MIDHGDAIFELRDAVPVELCRHIIARFEAEPRIAPGTVHRVDGSAAKYIVTTFLLHARVASDDAP